jgi:hypothetical protein
VGIGTLRITWWNRKYICKTDEENDEPSMEIQRSNSAVALVSRYCAASIKATYIASFDPWETWDGMMLRRRHDSHGRESQIGLET